MFIKQKQHGKVELTKQTTTDVKNKAADFQIERARLGLLPPMIQEQVEVCARKPSSRAKPKITGTEVLKLLDSCTVTAGHVRGTCATATTCLLEMVPKAIAGWQGRL